ncbi:hypothetical protein BD410DRAFT_843798 [Rickenella mellea]|uniref:CigA protein n=1 Tax=Rickenella mellea TaxID=50990 RepID=A0A4Y7PP80_9AGAM|nr:hypothetical protein BD410DRAFT_843798 [Rickenella mellea]
MWRRILCLVLAFASIFLLSQTLDLSQVYGKSKSKLILWKSGRHQTHADWPPKHPKIFEPLYDDSQDDARNTFNKSGPSAEKTLDEEDDEYGPRHNLRLEKLQDMVRQTKGYYTRDYSKALGWNNMRYILEASLLHARLLNRTLIIPSYVYARACDFDKEVCSAYADTVNRNEVFNSDEWKSQPLGWRVPITKMMDVPRLRRSQPVIILSDYLRLHGLPPSLETATGYWDRDKYHSQPSVFADEMTKGNAIGGRPSLFVLKNGWYDPTGTVRVDRLPQDLRDRGGWDPRSTDPDNGRVGEWVDSAKKSPLCASLEAALSENESTLTWDRAKEILLEHIGKRDEYEHDEPVELPEDERIKSAKFSRSRSRWPKTDQGLERELIRNGWEVVYTYEGALGMEYSKTVATPARQVAPRSRFRGLVEEYGHATEDVFLLEGETHLGRKPGGLRFTTSAGRDEFTSMILDGFHLPHEVLQLAQQIAGRMRDIVQGREWMGAHMRRGDFVNVGWVMEKSIEDHFKRIQSRLEDGRQILGQIAVEAPSEYNIPPLSDDPFYLATDERAPEGLDYIAQNRGIVIHDLLTINDYRTFGWSLVFTDVLSLVEQAVLAQSGYFYAHAMSSVPGAVLNIRAARKADPRTFLID